MMLKYFLPVLFIFILLFSSISGGNWQNVGGDPQHSGYSDSSFISLELIWKYKVGISDISAPIVDRGTLFVGSDDSNLYALDAKTGKLKWQYSALGKVYTPAAKDGLVFAASFDNNIYALDSNGNLKWKYNTGSSISSPPLVYNNILYGGFDRYIYAIYIINGSLKWKYPTDGWIESTPAISQGSIFSGSNDNNIYALDAGNKNLRWIFPTGGRVSSSPSIINGVVFIGSADNNIYAIDSTDGKLERRKKTNDEVKSSPAVFENSVYIGSNDNNIYSLDTDNGEILWKFVTNGWVDSPPVATKGLIYAGSKDGTIYVLDGEKGTLVNKSEVNGGIIALSISDNMLFTTSNDGYIYAFGTSPLEPAITSIPVDNTPPKLKINPVPINVTSGILKISGTAEDPSGILVVTVNGVNGGTTEWNTTYALSNGTNTITIVAVDKAGNIKTESRSVVYSAIPVTKETMTSQIPGFDILFSFLGFILTMYKNIIKIILTGKNKFS